MSGQFRAMTAFTQDEVNALFKAATTRYKNQGLEIRLASQHLPTGRILIITPRKCGNAPKRNRIRRRLKSIFYEDKIYQKGFDWIILVRKAAIDLSFEQLRNIISTVLDEQK